MQSLLLQLQARKSLSREQAADAFDAIMSGKVDPVVTAALLMGIAVNGVTQDEIAGAAQVMRRHATPVLVPGDTAVLDTCGTGGDVKHTFNISTAAAIVIAAAGVTVVKHGNRSASSKSGSADVLEALGVKIDAPPETLTRCLERANLCFAFARNHHPAMKHVAPVRQALGVPTLFNLLGPLTNPGRAKHQLLGVYKPHLTRMLAGVLQQLGSTRAWVVHGTDGLDELSTMSESIVTELRDGALNDFTVNPSMLGIPRARVEDLQVAGPAESAAAVRDVLAGKPGPRADIVAINAAAGIVIAGHAPDLSTALQKAREMLASGKARLTLETLVAASNAG